MDQNVPLIMVATSINNVATMGNAIQTQIARCIINNLMIHPYSTIHYLAVMEVFAFKIANAVLDFVVQF